LVFIKSEGTIQMAEGLDWPWRIAGVMRVLPLALRDRLYDWVARNRLQWFGKRQVCYLPDPKDADRFIASEPL
jgi:predicted DCC family thiol-disulfide oxidoreductase YuxK